jgi:hypothetical protein
MRRYIGLSFASLADVMGFRVRLQGLAPSERTWVDVAFDIVWLDFAKESGEAEKILTQSFSWIVFIPLYISYNDPMGIYLLDWHYSLRELLYWQ